MGVYILLIKTKTNKLAIYNSKFKVLQVTWLENIK